MDDDVDALGKPLPGLRRADVSLPAVAANADRLVDAESEVEQARSELEVVTRGLAGLVTSHRDLVRQLGEAAAALRPADRQDEERIDVGHPDAERSRDPGLAQGADAVDELARRLDRALAERVGGLLEAVELRAMERLPAQVPDTPPPAAEVAALAATEAAMAVEENVLQLLRIVQAGQRRVHQLVLAVGLAFLLFAALVSVLALR